MSAETTERISPLLRLLVEALEAQANSGNDRAVDALCELGQLARLQIPIRGVFPMSDDQLFNAVDSIAVKHLDLGGVRQTLNEALVRVEPFALRDEVEVAIDHLCAVLNVAYFNAGLAFGVTLADLRST